MHRKRTLGRNTAVDGAPDDKERRAPMAYIPAFIKLIALLCNGGLM